MHLTTGHYSLAKAHVADLRHRAQRTALARAEPSPTSPGTPIPCSHPFGRRMLTALGARST